MSVNLTYITNGFFTIGLDLGKGGTIFSLATPNSENVLLHSNSNPSDVLAPYGEGLLVAPYGDGGGIDPENQYSAWNPSQTGSWPTNEWSSIVDSQFNEDGSYYLKVDCALFQPEGVLYPPDMYIEIWVDYINTTVMRMRYKCTYYGNHDLSGNYGYAQTWWNFPALPGWPQALYMCLESKYKHLYYYDGASPWSNGALTQDTLLTGNPYATYRYPTEKWVASVDDASGIGVGIYHPEAAFFEETYWSPYGGQYGYSDNVVTSPNMAHGFSTAENTSNSQNGRYLDTTFYITIGSVSEIRSRFQAIAPTPTTTSTTTTTTTTTTTAAPTTTTTTAAPVLKTADGSSGVVLKNHDGSATVTLKRYVNGAWV